MRKQNLIITIFFAALVMTSFISYKLGQKSNRPVSITETIVNTNTAAETTVDNLAGCGEKPSLPENIVGSCRIRLISPRDCELIDLRNSKSFKFEWTADGTDCKLPWIVMAAGNPIVNIYQENFKEDGTLITSKGGIIMLDSQKLKALNVNSDNGLYHWVVKGQDGSHPDSKTFRVRQ